MELMTKAHLDEGLRRLGFGEGQLPWLFMDAGKVVSREDWNTYPGRKNYLDRAGHYVEWDNICQALDPENVLSPDIGNTGDRVSDPDNSASRIANALEAMVAHAETQTGLLAAQYVFNRAVVWASNKNNKKLLQAIVDEETRLSNEIETAEPREE